MALKILFEHDRLLVVEKPAGTTVLPNPQEERDTVANELQRSFPELTEDIRYGVVHRLDKDTSGILLVARDGEALEFFQQQFQNRQVKKAYLCLVEGNVTEDGGTLKGCLSRSPKDRRKQKVSETGREAVTDYTVKDRFDRFTLIEAFPKTGRKHQLRAQFAHRGTPIAGDELYGFKDQKVPQGLQRQFLHASKIEVMMPDGTAGSFASPLPKDLQNVLDGLQEKDHG